MFTLHILKSPDDTLQKAVASLGIVEPYSGRVFDFATRKVIDPRREDVVALLSEGGAYFAPDLKKTPASILRRANPDRINPPPIPLRARRPLETEFSSGYTAYARDAALFWRDFGASSQVILTAGVFALASIRTGIQSTLKLTASLTPYLVENALPDRKTLVSLCQNAGVGIQENRAEWFLDFEKYVPIIEEKINQEGLRDDYLRSVLCIEKGLPVGLSTAKISFILAILGNNLGCLDARILNWAYGDGADKISKDIARKAPNGKVKESAYELYEDIEDDVLTNVPYFVPTDPLGLARAQWMLWEQLGKSGPEYHDHQELFDAVQDPRFFWEAL